MVHEQLEIERKFDVDPGFVPPALGGVPGVAAAGPPRVHDLEAVYHDTADLRLARGRVTLRRRTGGPDAGWHLKLPAGAARREVHLPLDRGTDVAPAELLELAAGLLEGAPTGPVVTLRTRRVVVELRDGAGRVLAEVADDTVTATLPPTASGVAPEVRSWRELEVELVDGEEPLLAAVGEVLVAAGARPSPRASKLAFALSARLADEG
ncbi:CYTH domain-containing protein [Blastococcus xanthinilyticus]|uniref:CYTH domain-containing protein n=1 Tax=Blastococcus xanthinilyticus TaxID=1564164 RepID=A0A5S5CU43_9ACTN|nr:CYTH domain-containing protein [Blastococcus xanthinilyticus]TYP86498.1 CYTH domain-containing protein [Blastococcus xanthinilyticus]